MLKQDQHNNTLLIDCQFFGTIDYYKILFQFSNIEIEQYETYQKMSFRNRCMVAGSNGVVGLSVPIEKGRGQRGLMKDTRISREGNWRIQHWRTIASCYSRAPFFEFYSDGVHDLLLRDPVFLLDWNLEILDWLKRVLKLPAAIHRSPEYRKTPPEGMTDLRKRFLPKNYQTVPWDLKYTQVFEDRIGFQPNLCILDLLFCCGPETRGMLQTTI